MRPNNAELFEFEEEVRPGDLAGRNPRSRKVRNYLPGDELLGVAYAPSEADVLGVFEPSAPTTVPTGFAPVARIGQVQVNRDQVQDEPDGQLRTLDGILVGYRLANGLVLIRFPAGSSVGSG